MRNNNGRYSCAVDRWLRVHPKPDQNNAVRNSICHNRRGPCVSIQNDSEWRHTCACTGLVCPNHDNRTPNSSALCSCNGVWLRRGNLFLRQNIRPYSSMLLDSCCLWTDMSLSVRIICKGLKFTNSQTKTKTMRMFPNFPFLKQFVVGSQKRNL